MKLYNNRGKYTGGAKRKNAKLVRFLVGLMVVLLVLLGAMGWFLLSLHNAENDFRELAAQVQEHVPETTDATIAAAISGDGEETVADATEPVQETVPVMLPQYAMLYEQNADVFGWLCIDGTAIDYPVMHTPDEPERYLHTDFLGEYSYPGVPFVDAACTPDSDNLLIYGHNMGNGSMFHCLLEYAKKDYWEEHPVITFDTLYEEQKYEVLAAFYDRVYYKSDTCFKFYKFIDAAYEADFDYAIAQFKEKSLYDTGVDAEYGDKLITLVTCAYHTDNGRFVVVARKK